MPDHDLGTVSVADVKTAIGSLLPEPPDIKDYATADAFKDAIRDWETRYEFAYNEAHPVSGPFPPPAPPEPQRPAEPIMPPQPTIDWTSVCKEDPEPYVVIYHVGGRVVGEQTLVSGESKMDLRGSADQPVATWGEAAQEVYAREARRDWDEEKNVKAAWPTVLRKRDNIDMLAESKAKSWVVDLEWRSRLGEYGKQMQEWYFKQYLPYEIKRVQWATACNTIRDWETARRLEKRKRQALVQLLVRATVFGAAIAGGVLVGLRWF